jgi:DNA polymerase-1
MHTDPELIESWINYSTLDSEITYFLYETLKKELFELKTNFEDMHNMLDLYNKYWNPFGELLTDMERNGFKVDV